MMNGNMVCGVTGDSLILRLGEAEAGWALAQPHVKAFDMTGRPMKGWVMVAPEGVPDEKALQRWLGKARGFAQSLPSKQGRPMNVTVKLFASVRRYLPKNANGNSCVIKLNTGATVATLVDYMSIPPDIPKMMLVNGLHCDSSHKLTEGDVVSIIPPIAGG